MRGSQAQTNRDLTFVLEEDDDGGALVKYGKTRNLDYEQLKSYNITVRATVSGGHSDPNEGVSFGGFKIKLNLRLVGKLGVSHEPAVL